MPFGPEHKSTFGESMDREIIPENATHKWIPGDEYYNPYVNRLHFYTKQEDGDAWMVYSPITGWRVSQNSEEWFNTEIAEGRFVKIHG